MSQFVTTRTKAFTAGGALGSNIRVTLSDGKLAAADASTVELGTTIQEAFADGDVVQVVLRSANGTVQFVASEAITAGNTFYAAASGKVASTGTVALGTALETTSADGDYMEGLRAGPVVASGDYATLTGTEELTGKTVTAQVVKNGLTASGSSSNDFSGSTGTFKTSTGLNTLGGQLAVKHTVTPVAAAGSAVGDAAALAASSIVHITSDGAAKGVVLPAVAGAGVVMIVVNNSSTAAELYAESTGTVNGLSADASVVIPASKGLICISTAAKTWLAFDLTAKATAS